MMFSNDSLIHTMNQIIDECMRPTIPFKYEIFMKDLNEKGKPILLNCPLCHKPILIKNMKYHKKHCGHTKVYET